MMNKILGLLLVSVFLVSCGSDDDDKDQFKPVEKEIVYSFSQSLKGYANDQVGHNATIVLTQVLPTENKGFIAGSFQSARSLFVISNYTQTNPTLVLRDFTITVGATEFNLGDCKVGGIQAQGDIAPGIEYSGENANKVSKAIYEAIVSKQQQAAIKVSYVPSEDFKDVTLKVNFGALYTYNVLAN